MDTANGIGGDAERSNAQIAAHWLEASARHGMPVRTAGFRMFTDQDRSTWPMCEAYEAARLVDEGLAARYLRRLREANAAEALQVNRVEVQAELAAEVGLDVGRFLGALRDGSARAAFQADLAETARHGVCVHRPMPITDSGGSRSVIPVQADHRFRSKPIAERIAR